MEDRRVPRANRASAAFWVFLALVSPWPSLAEVVVRVPEDAATLSSAVALVPDGGTIELNPGVHTPPPNGFDLSDLQKGFTVRSGPGMGKARIQGTSSGPLLRIENSTPENGRPIVFEDIIFEFGAGSIPGVAAGVTLERAEVTFVRCEFTNNGWDFDNSPGIAGGAVGVHLGSRAFFYRAYVAHNEARNYGGGMAVSGESVAYILESNFEEDRTDRQNVEAVGAGGALAVFDSDVFSANSRYYWNSASTAGGAVYARGGWPDEAGGSGSRVVISNSMFDRNSAGRWLEGDATSGGGAVRVEARTALLVTHSLFGDNWARPSGGSISSFRAAAEIDESEFTFRSGYLRGGAIYVGSDDLSGEESDRPAGSLELRRSFFQILDAVTPTPQAHFGGCLYVSGDAARRRGDVLPQSTAEAARASVVVEDVVFDRCRTAAANDVTGGAFHFDLANVSLTDAFVLRSSAVGQLSSGGGGGIVWRESIAELSNVTFGANMASGFGGGLAARGSKLDIADSTFLSNRFAIPAPFGADFGAGELGAPSSGGFGSTDDQAGSALFTSGLDDWPTAGEDLDQIGTVSTSLFSGSSDFSVFLHDEDRNAFGEWINDQRFDGNTFRILPSTGDVYTDSLACCNSTTELNGLVVKRVQGDTDKSQIENLVVTSAPALAQLRIVPTELPTPPRFVAMSVPQSRAGVAWSGSGATLDGAPVENLRSVPVSPGEHELSVDGVTVTDASTVAPPPAVRFFANPVGIGPGESTLLTWETMSGEPVELAIDQGVGRGLEIASSAAVTPVADTTYRIFLTARQGGAMAEVRVFVGSSEYIFLDGFEIGDTSLWSEVGSEP